ncbi:hypothetical protein K440DRAFT_54472 [Wilcoxina mikolae CBS 423.85]|nr:hypothetical protein K440DRAFT_54472 [Wilcoxina mikolae CBS 423.85]
MSAKESPRSKGMVEGQKSEGNRMSKTKRRVVDDGWDDHTYDPDFMRTRSRMIVIASA